MKFLTHLLLVGTLFILNNINAQQTITATVVNVASVQGKVSFALFNKDNFLQKPLQASASMIKEGNSVVVFKDIPEGNYAVICFHDQNNNNKMDFQSNGVPAEDYGVSTNNVNPYGPPIFNDTKFKVSNKDVSLEIKF